MLNGLLHSPVFENIHALAKQNISVLLNMCFAKHSACLTRDYGISASQTGSTSTGVSNSANAFEEEVTSLGHVKFMADNQRLIMIAISRVEFATKGVRQRSP